MEKTFVVNDQLIMEQANNYNNWLYDLIKPIIGGTTLEIGGGIGNLTNHILSNSKVRKHVVVDIDDNCLSYLRQHIAQNLPEKAGKGEYLHGDFNTVTFNNISFDVVVCFNVLEHLENDREAIKRIYELLTPGGHVVLFVPAFDFLFGEIDKELKHFRRYNKSDLLYLLQKNSFRDIKMRYFNIFGFFGWFFNFKILKRKCQNLNQILFFDKYIFPVQFFFEKYAPWQPIGQSLYAVAKK